MKIIFFIMSVACTLGFCSPPRQLPKDLEPIFYNGWESACF